MLSCLILQSPSENSRIVGRRSGSPRRKRQVLTHGVGFAVTGVFNIAQRGERMPVPLPVKRRLRQEAAFGCCRCGFPIYQFHHIVPGSQDPVDIMVLCPNCHHMATIGAMAEAEQRYHKLDPFNIKRGYTNGQLKVNQNAVAVSIGSNQFVNDGDLILIDEESLVSLNVDHGGRLEVSLRLYDRTDRLLASVIRNEWISGEQLPWDLQSGFQWLRILQGPRDVALELDARKNPVGLVANLWRKHQNISLSGEWIRFNGVVKNVGFANLCFVALQLAVDTKGGRFLIRPDPRYGRGHFVSWPDEAERIRKGLRLFSEMVQERDGLGVA